MEAAARLDVGGMPLGLYQRPYETGPAAGTGLTLLEGSGRADEGQAVPQTSMCPVSLSCDS
jgi:hypothetical protein